MIRHVTARLTYFTAWLLVKFLQALPLPWVAQLGRLGGAIAYWVDRRHRRVAIRNLTLCYGGDRTAAQIRAVARQNFRRIGENYCSAIKTASMSWEALKSRVEFVGPAWVHASPADPARDEVPSSMVLAIGHFGNFEVYARLGSFNPAYRCATTYRAFQPASLNRLLQSLREKSGCQYFERRTDVAALKAWMAPRGRIVGFLADQHAGRSGVRGEFFGHECSTTAAPVVFALRYRLPLAVGICYRTGLARWRIELSDEIATSQDGRPRPIEAVTRDINQVFEAAVRRNPANWFWVHNRWKPNKLPSVRPNREPTPAATTPAPDTRPKVRALADR